MHHVADRADRSQSDVHAEAQPARTRAADLRQPRIPDLGHGREPRRTGEDGRLAGDTRLTRSIKGETLEFCHIIEGLVEITSEQGETWTFKAGDSFVMKPGFVGTWKTIETVKKVYLVVY